MQLSELVVFSLIVMSLVALAVVLTSLSLSTLSVATADEEPCYTTAQWDSIYFEWAAQVDFPYIWVEACNYDSVRLDMLRWLWPILFLCDPLECRDDSNFALEYNQAYKEARDEH